MKINEIFSPPKKTPTEIKAAQAEIRAKTAKLQNTHDKKMREDPQYRDWHNSMIKHYEKKGHTEGD